jgi:hypothetical protein
MKSNKFFFWYYLFTSIFAQSTAPLDKIKQQDLKDDLYEGWRLSRKKRRRTWWNASFCLGGSKAREAGLKCAKMEPTSSSLI